MTKPEIKKMSVAVSPAGCLTFSDIKSATTTVGLSLLSVAISAMLNYLITTVIPSIPTDNPYWVAISPAILGVLKLIQKSVEQRIYPLEK